MYVFFCEFWDTKEFQWLGAGDRQLGKLQSKGETNHRSSGYQTCLLFSCSFFCCSLIWTTCSVIHGSVLFFGKCQSSCWWDVSMETFLRTRWHSHLYLLDFPRRWTDIRGFGKRWSAGMDLPKWMHPVFWRGKVRLLIHQQLLLSYKTPKSTISAIKC